jgi:hypothetical protein
MGEKAVGRDSEQESIRHKSREEIKGQKSNSKMTGQNSKMTWRDLGLTIRGLRKILRSPFD